MGSAISEDWPLGRMYAWNLKHWNTIGQVFVSLSNRCACVCVVNSSPDSPYRDIFIHLLYNMATLAKIEADGWSGFRCVRFTFAFDALRASCKCLCAQSVGAGTCAKHDEEIASWRWCDFMHCNWEFMMGFWFSLRVSIIYISTSPHFTFTCHLHMLSWCL